MAEQQIITGFSKRFFVSVNDVWERVATCWPEVFVFAAAALDEADSGLKERFETNSKVHSLISVPFFGRGKQSLHGKQSRKLSKLNGYWPYFLCHYETQE